jgi:hypothetical protein
MTDNIVSLTSVVIAVAAVVVATWQVRASARNAERSHTLPVISETFREFRSAEFRASVGYLIANVPEPRGEHGFNSLPKEWRDNAYKVCYFFDYLGALVEFSIIREELVISLWGTSIIHTWQAAVACILMERSYRRSTYPPGISPGFLVYYEDLVCRIIDRGGQDAAKRIQQESGLRRLDAPLDASLASREVKRTLWRKLAQLNRRRPTYDTRTNMRNAARPD